MKREFKILILLFLMVGISILSHLYYIHSLSAVEKYPKDTYLSSEINKNALIIVAHDDDIVTCTGTLKMLSKNGWNIRQMCFYQLGGTRFKKDSVKNPIRKKDLKRAAATQGLSGVDPVDFNFRDFEMEKTWYPVPKDSFVQKYDIDSLFGYIEDYIDNYKPSVIFTLDNEIGFYGHPEHVMISQLVLDYCKKHKLDSGFTVKRIYQPVFPPSLVQNILEGGVYTDAKRVYETNGMPLPDVEVDVISYNKERKTAMQAYTTEQGSIKKIYPFYNWYPSWIYFNLIFEDEYYRVIDINDI